MLPSTMSAVDRRVSIRTTWATSPTKGQDIAASESRSRRQERRFAGDLERRGVGTSYDNFLRDFGECFVPGYKAVSTVDLLMNARFERSVRGDARAAFRVAQGRASVV